MANTNKVHFVHLSSGPGGIEVLLPKIAEAMNKKEFNAFVIRTTNHGVNVYNDTSIRITYGNNGNFIAALKLFWYVIRHRNEIFHVFNIGPFFLLVMKMGGARKLVYSIHGTRYYKKRYQKNVFPFLWRWSLSPRFILAANSEYSRSVFLDKVKKDVNIRVLYNPIADKRFSPVKSHPFGKEILIVYAGRLTTGKNLEKWINIAVKVHEQMPNTRFEIYGQGKLEANLRAQIEHLNSTAYIQLMGFRKDVENIYRGADLLLFLSEYESFGNVVVECILCGTPVLSSPIPSMKEIFKDFPDFILENEEAYQKLVLERLNRLDELKRLAQLARCSFLKRFGMFSHIDSLGKIYDEYA